MKKLNQIQFILNGQIKTLSFEDEGLLPSTTVLNYLRGLPDRKGVKEGCAEGDCGACTVVLAEAAADDKLEYRAYDSCLLFLPMLHGKQLITVEDLADKRGPQITLHPVQQEMVDLHGSQCGYCTPGIVMSLFSLYKNHQNPSREVAEDALTGNLCRCTGYRPILEAALSACSHKGVDSFSETEKDTASQLKQILANQPAVIVEGKKQSYFRPGNLKQALEIRQKHPEALVINGATDVALRQTKKHEFLPSLLDLSGVEEMKSLNETKDDFLIGAGTSMENLRGYMENRISECYKILSVFASLQIRNIATVGGNIASASPIGDILPLLFAMKASVRLQSQKEKRELSIEDFIMGYRKTALAQDELVVQIVIPKVPEDVNLWSYKVSKRSDLDISTLSAGFRLQLKDGEVEDIVLAYGGMAECTKRASEVEKALIGQKWEQSSVEKTMPLMDQCFTPISDARAGKEFRMLAAKNLMLKFYLKTKEK